MNDPQHRDSILPGLDEVPVSARGRNSRALLDRLAETGHTEDDFVPGTEAPAGSFDFEDAEASHDLLDLAEQIEFFANGEASALAQGRAFAVTSGLWAAAGNTERAREAAREGSVRAPRLAVAGALYRQNGADQDEPEEQQKQLEAAARLAGHPASRSHAALALFELLRESGETERASTLLDHAARSGSLDPRIGLGRLLLRLSTGQNILGLDAPEALQKSAVRALEALGGRTAEGSASHLILLRVVRALERGDVLTAAEGLAKRPEPAARELAAALLCSRPEQRKRGRELLVELARLAPTRSVLRALALQCVGDQDWAALRGVLETADPASGTFSLGEQLVLRLVSGEAPNLSQEELAELATSSPRMALSLAPLDAPPEGNFGPEVQSARLGAQLSRLASAAAVEALGPQVSAAEALTTSILRLDLALGSDDTLGASAALTELAQRLEDPGLQFLGAVLLERATQNDAAQEAYGTVEHEGELAWAALRGRLALDPTLERSNELQGLVEKLDDPERAADALLESALSPSPDAPAQRGERLLRAAALWDEPALLLAATSLAEAEGDRETFAQALALAALSAGSELGRFSRLRAALDALEASPASAAAQLGELARNGASDEPSLHWTAAWLLERNGQAPLAAGPASSWSLAKHAASKLLDRDEAASLTGLRALGELRASSSGRALIDELAEASGDVARLAERWLAAAKSDDAGQRLYAYERLAELDQRRGDRSGALLWRRSAAEEIPSALSSLLSLEDQLLFEGRFDEWPSVSAKLGALLPPGDREAYALVSSSFALGELDLREARRRLEPLLKLEKPPLLALRSHLSAAKERADDALIGAWGELLAARASSDLDQVALHLEVAYAAARSDQPERALDFATRALGARSDLFASQLLVTKLVPEEDQARQATALIHLAAISEVPAQRAALWLDAGELWLEQADNPQAKDAFRYALLADPNGRQAFSELSELYLEEGALDELCQLLGTRLELSLEPRERLELEFRTAEIRIELGQPAQARQHLERALALGPREPRLLRLHAGICVELGDARGAENSWAKLLIELGAPDDEPERIQTLRTLGELYENQLDELEKAMDAYESLLTLVTDRQIEARLVGVFARLGLSERATNLQTQLIQTATTDDEKRKGALGLAALYEGIGRDPQRALATLERTHKAWPLDAEVLEATALFMDRQGETVARRALVERVGKEARRSLEGTRLDATLFDTLSRVARLSEIPSQAEATLAARAAFLGEEFACAGGFVRALDPALDDLLAPAVLSAPLRNLLRRTGSVLDTAFSLDLSALGAQRCQAGPAWQRLAEFARSLGDAPPEVFVAASLGSRCQLLTSQPLRFVIGPGLDDLEPGAQDYQLARAFKLKQLGAAALARSRPEDAWPMLAGLLLLFAPTWQPRGVDARKVAQARTLAEQGLARVGYDDDVPTLALEAIGALGEQGENVGAAVRTLALRTGLLAIGEPGAALWAMSAGSDKPLPASGPSRFRWIEGHPEAKELLLFAISDELARARERLELAPGRTARAPLPPRAASLGPVPPRRS